MVILLKSPVEKRKKKKMNMPLQKQSTGFNEHHRSFLTAELKCKLTLTHTLANAI